MPDKLTDKEIVKALEVCCTKKPCRDCVYLGKKELCIADNTIAVLDLITRLQARVEKCEKVEHFADKTIATLQAENEQLKKENKLLIDNDVRNKYPNCVLVEKGRIYTKTLDDYDELIADISAEAYKEFAERLKEIMQKYCGDITEDDLDNLLKELVGEDK